MATFCSKDAGSRDRQSAKNREWIRHTGSNWVTEDLQGWRWRSETAVGVGWKWGCSAAFQPLVPELLEALLLSYLDFLGMALSPYRRSLVEVVSVPDKPESPRESSSTAKLGLSKVPEHCKDKQQCPKIRVPHNLTQWHQHQKVACFKQMHIDSWAPAGPH